MKNILIACILVILTGCNRNPEINDIINNEKIIKEIDKLIVDSDKKNVEKFFIVSGIDSSDYNEAEILFTNKKPVIIKEDLAALDKLRNEKFGYFKYKNYEFLVAEKMQSIFKLDYEDFEHSKEHFTETDKFSDKNEIMKKNWRTMYLKYNKIKDSIEFSNIAEVPMSELIR